MINVVVNVPGLIAADDYIGFPDSTARPACT